MRNVVCDNAGGVGSDEGAWVGYRVGVASMEAGGDAAAHFVEF
jgi:hypothetical protein